MSIFHFSDSAEIPFSLDNVFAWHQRPGALARLLPPWIPTRVLSEAKELHVGDRAVIQSGPATFESIHTELHTPRDGYAFFADQLRRGPIQNWYHRHTFAGSVTHTRVGDEIDISVPGVPRSVIISQLRAMCAYRYRQLQYDLTDHARSDNTLTVAISGASGLLGQQLAALLTSGGHRVRRLVRREVLHEGEISWDPTAGQIESEKLRECDAVVHLAGEPLYGRWTNSKMKEIRESRINSTALIASTLARLTDGPRVLINASAVGIYGSSATPSDENTKAGEGFLAELVQEWEAATAPAVDAGVRVVLPRLGVVLTPRAGLLARQLPAFLAGLGGPIGSKDRCLSWISETDAVSLLYYSLLTDTLEGPVNATAPEPVRWEEYVAALGRVLHRPSRIPLPVSAVSLVLGRQAAQHLAAAGQNAPPAAALAAGYEFHTPTLESALRHVLGRL